MSAGPKTQQQEVETQLSSKNKLVTDIIRVPGIETLHTKPVDEIASVLTNILKSRTGIISLKYNIGKNIEIVCDGNPFNQL